MKPEFHAVQASKCRAEHLKDENRGRGGLPGRTAKTKKTLLLGLAGGGRIAVQRRARLVEAASRAAASRQPAASSAR